MLDIIKTTISSFFKYSIMIFLLFIWLINIIENVYVTITISFVIAIIIDLTINTATKRKRKVQQLKKTERKEVDKLSKQFLFWDNKNTLKYFNEILSKHHKTTLKNNYIIITKVDENIILYTSYNSLELQQIEIINVYNICKKHNIAKALILTNKVNESLCEFTKIVCDVNITIYDINDTYKNILKKYNSLPHTDIKVTEKKGMNLSELAKVVFNIKLAKNYILSGFLVLFASFFTKYKLYYTIISTVLLFLSLICIFKNKESKNNFIDNDLL